MPATVLDPKTALIVIDLQKGIVAMTSPEVSGPVIANSAALACAFRARSLPVVLVRVDPKATNRTEQPRRGPMPPEFLELIPEILQKPNAQPTDHHVTKHNWGAFTTTHLAELLHSLDVTQVVVCGVATSIGVESTARQANELGFNVTLATDAMTDLRPEAHANSIANIFPRLGETATTAEIIALLP